MQEDPPSMNVTPPRDITIVDSITMVAGIGNYNMGDLTAKISEQAYGGGTPEFYFQIESMKIWGPSATSGEVVLTHEASGMTVSDFGSLSYRAKVGLHFSPVIQVVRLSSGTGNIFSIASSGATDLIDIRCSIRTWSSVPTTTAFAQHRQ
jgi:hypothetical protein